MEGEGKDGNSGASEHCTMIIGNTTILTSKGYKRGRVCTYIVTCIVSLTTNNNLYPTYLSFHPPKTRSEPDQLVDTQAPSRPRNELITNILNTKSLTPTTTPPSRLHRTRPNSPPSKLGTHLSKLNPAPLARNPLRRQTSPVDTHFVHPRLLTVGRVVGWRHDGLVGAEGVYYRVE